MQEKLDNARFRNLLSSWPEKAIHYLYEYYSESLMRQSEWKTHNRIASEDIVQESIAEIWERREWILSQATMHVERYLVAIVRNKSISYYKKVHRIGEAMADFKVNALMDFSAKDESEILNQDKVVWGIVSQFPRREAECLHLKYNFNLTTVQIGVRLGISVKSVERSITSAYKRLRQYKEQLV